MLCYFRIILLHYYPISSLQRSIYPYEAKGRLFCFPKQSSSKGLQILLSKGPQNVFINRSTCFHCIILIRPQLSQKKINYYACLFALVRPKITNYVNSKSPERRSFPRFLAFVFHLCSYTGLFLYKDLKKS